MTYEQYILSMARETDRDENAEPFDAEDIDRLVAEIEIDLDFDLYVMSIDDEHDDE